MKYLEDGGTEKIVTNGMAADIVHEWFELLPGEAIQVVSGTFDQVPDGSHTEVTELTFTTNRGRIYSFGVPSKAPQPFSIPVPPGGRLCGFFGRSGFDLDAIGCWLRTAKNNIKS